MVVEHAAKDLDKDSGKEAGYLCPNGASEEGPNFRTPIDSGLERGGAQTAFESSLADFDIMQLLTA